MCDRSIIKLLETDDQKQESNFWPRLESSWPLPLPPASPGSIVATHILYILPDISPVTSSDPDTVSITHIWKYDIS